MLELSLGQVALALVPVGCAFIIYGVSVGDWRSIAWATLRMLVQLLLVGYLLTTIFELQQPLWVLVIVLMMSIGAGWISGRAIRAYKKSILPIIGSVIVSGALNLAWILIFILQPEPWFSASIVIPITGMVMANSMNAVSLCAERYWSERSNQYDHQNAAKTAMTAAMIPQINALLAVGIVSLPGMMTGQILSGVSPLIAVRYQIVIMAMILSTAAFGSFLYLWWYARNNEA